MVKQAASEIKFRYEEVWSPAHTEALAKVEKRFLLTKADKYDELLRRTSQEKNEEECRKEFFRIVRGHFWKDLVKGRSITPRVLKPGRHHREAGDNPEGDEKEQDEKFCSFCSMDELEGDTEADRNYRRALSNEAAHEISRTRIDTSFKWVRRLVDSLPEESAAREIAEGYLKAANEGDEKRYKLSFTAMGTALELTKKQIELARAALEKALRQTPRSGAYFTRREKIRDQAKKMREKAKKEREQGA